MRYSSFSAALLFLAALGAPAQDDVVSPLAALPRLPKPQPTIAQVLPPLTIMAPGIAIAPAQRLVVLDGRIQIDQGPADGLEVVLCLNGGKSHETIMTLDTGAAESVKAACIVALGVPAAERGAPAQGARQPARGTLLRVQVLWQDPDQAQRQWEADASCLVRERITDQPYPALPFIYTGSRFLAISVPGPDGQPVQRQQFMLGSTRTVIAAYDEPDALLASPFPDSWRDHHYEVNSGIVPPAGTAVRVVLSRTTVPLTLQVTARGELEKDGVIINDFALEQLLAHAYGEGAHPSLRAVAIAASATVSADNDEAVRERILKVAAAAKAWVVPVFIFSE